MCPGCGPHVRRVVVLVGSLIVVAASLSRTSPPNISHRFLTAHSTLASAQHTLYLPLLVQDARSTTHTSHVSWSTPIARSPLDGAIWVVNPDAGSVSVVDPKTLTKTVEIAVGQSPWSLAISPEGRTVYVVDRASGTLVVLDAHSHQIRATIPIGPEPAAVVVSPTGSTAYVAISSADEIVSIDTQRLTVSARIPVGRYPYALAVSNDNRSGQAQELLYVTHLLALPRPGRSEATDDGHAGHMTLLDPATHLILKEITLSPDEHGFPNLLSGIAIAGNYAWIPHARSSPALPNSLTTTVFAAVSALDLATNEEDSAAFLPLNDQEIFGSPVNNPVATAPSPDGKTLYIVLAGSNLVEVVDITLPHRPRLVRFLPTGSNPRGIALSADGRWGYVMSYLSRTITVLDLDHLERLTDIPVTTETLDPVVLRGKILFNNASEPRLSQASWLSCASCHTDGGNDGVTWMTPDGPRQTPALWAAARTKPLHWSATLDELHDVEGTITTFQHGLGLATGQDPPLLGAPNAGRSADLDALAAFLAAGIRVPTAPLPSGGVEHGRQLFAVTGCATCHGGPMWTSSALPGAPGTLDPDGNGMLDLMLNNVGTNNPHDVRGETGFDVPSLLNVGLTPPYLHDGSMPTLAALLASGHPHPSSAGNGLTPQEITDLSAFVHSIGVGTEPIGNNR